MAQAVGSDRSPLVVAQVYANAAQTKLRANLAQQEYALPGVGRTIQRVSETRFEAIFDRYDDDVVFVHAGLSAVKSAFNRNPYTYLRDTLLDSFDSVLVPGFTPSFRQTGVYHKQYSKPEYGAFARQFLSDATYRTDDAIHSILVAGEYRFDGCVHSDTFGSNGCWAQLDTDNVLYCNVGTPWIVSTQHHLIEHRADVPYNHTVSHDGVIYYDDKAYSPLTQQNYRYDMPARRSAPKILRDMRNEGVIDHYDLDGLKLNFFRARDLRERLVPKLKADPYYLIA